MSRISQLKPRKIFGYQLMLDLYECNHDAVNNLEICYNYLNDLVDLIGVHRQSPPFVVYTDEKMFPDKAGVSGWIPIVESGFSIHTIAPTNFASIDIYSCKKFDREKVKKFTIKIFKPRKIEEKFFIRGKKYTHPGR